MPGLPLQAAPPTWAVQNFATIELSDVRRVRRVGTIAEAMATQPGRSSPQLFATPYEVKAAYTLFRQAEATPDTLQAGQRAAVKAEMRQPGEYLLIEDTRSCTSILRISLQPTNQIVYHRFSRGEGKRYGRPPHCP
jgi:Transposase DNA-binding